MSRLFRASCAVMPLALALSACSSLPRERGYQASSQLVQDRLDVASSWPTIPEPVHDTTQTFADQPISADQAIARVVLHNPRTLALYSRIGLARADLDDARRAAHLTFGIQRLRPDAGLGSQITRSLSLGLSELLLLPARKRLAGAQLEQAQTTVAAAVVALAGQAETAWVRAVSARQVAQMRALVAESADASAALAQRFFDAGNIARLQLERELAAAAQARIGAVRAQARAIRARSALADLLALPAAAGWQIPDQLPAPRALPESLSADAMIELALSQRLDLVAAKQTVAQREDQLGITRRWRWLGAVELGYERESEPDGSTLRGPELAWSLPLFNQGQGALARADAHLLKARAQLDERVLEVHNQVRLALDQLRSSFDIAEHYRSALLAHREAIVAGTGEQVNFMLAGVFELIAARQDQYDAYQEYLEAVRDYWLARAELRQQVGGRLPDDDAPLLPAVGVEQIAPPSGPDRQDHQHHHDSAIKQPGRGQGEGKDSSAKATAESGSHHHHHTPTDPAGDTP